MDSHGWCPWSLWVVLWVDLRGGVWVARCLGVGGTVGLWGWGRLIISYILIFFLSPVGERGLLRMTMVVTAIATSPGQHGTPGKTKATSSSQTAHPEALFTGGHTWETEMRLPIQAHATSHVTTVTHSVSRPTS